MAQNFLKYFFSVSVILMTTLFFALPSQAFHRCGSVFKSPLDTEEILFRYPELERNLKRAERSISGQEFHPSVTKADEIPWSDLSTGYLTDTQIALLSSRFPTLDKGLQNTILGLYNHMRAPSQFIEYMRKLSAETVLETEAKQVPFETILLSQGVLSEEAFIRTIVRRARERGHGPLSIVLKSGDASRPNTQSKKFDTNEGFRLAVQQGPFIDKKFKNYGHGMYSHLIQMDYVHDFISRSMNGQSRRFWDFIGSQQGIIYWVPLFDSTYTVSFNHPEFLNGILKKYYVRELK